MCLAGRSPCGCSRYIALWQGVVGLILILCLIVMLRLEPLLHCMVSGHTGFYERRKESEDPTSTYPAISAIGTFLYFLLLIDPAVLKTSCVEVVRFCPTTRRPRTPSGGP